MSEIQVRAPGGFIDGFGTCYIYDSDGNQVYKMGSDGNVTMTVTSTGAEWVGVGGSGTFVYTGDKTFLGFVENTPVAGLEPTYVIGETYTIYSTDLLIVEGEEIPAPITFDLSTLNLPAGTHTITVKARASGYADSAESAVVSYVV